MKPLMTYCCNYIEENPTLSNFIEFLIDIKNQHGDIKIATYDYEFGSIKKAVFDNSINIYLKNGPEGELIRVNKDDEDAEEYILINI